MTTDSDILMGPADVCTLLDIKESTLRKYAILLKDAGYQFHVNDKGQRGYFNHDVIVLKRLIETKRSRDMTLEKAVDAVIAWVKQSDMSLSVMDGKQSPGRYGEDIKELKGIISEQGDQIAKQNELLETLVKKLDEQQAYINDRLEKRDRILMESLKASQETKKLLLESQEEQKKKRKGIFSLFNKG